MSSGSDAAPEAQVTSLPDSEEQPAGANPAEPQQGAASAAAACRPPEPTGDPAAQPRNGKPQKNANPKPETPQKKPKPPQAKWGLRRLAACHGPLVLDAFREALAAPGADPNGIRAGSTDDSHDRTAIHVALRNGDRPDLIQLCLDHGADVDTPSREHPILIAAKSDRKESIKLLLAATKLPFSAICTPTGRNVLHMARSAEVGILLVNDERCTSELFLQHDHIGRMPMESHVVNGHTELVEVLAASPKFLQLPLLVRQSQLSSASGSAGSFVRAGQIVSGHTRLLGEGQYGVAYRSLWRTEQGSMYDIVIKVPKSGVSLEELQVARLVPKSPVLAPLLCFAKELDVSVADAVEAAADSAAKKMQRMGLSRSPVAFTAMQKHRAAAAAIAEATTTARESFVSELCPGGDLLHFLRRARGRLPVPTALTIAWQIAKAVAHLHGHGVVHRDLAARNVLLALPNATSVLVADFGLAVPVGLHDEESSSSGSAATAAPAESKPVALPWPWLPPDALRTMKFTAASDVWSLGVTFWEFWTAHQVGRPYSGVCSDPRDLVMRTQADGACLLDMTAVPQAFRELIHFCCTVDVTQRPTTDQVVEKIAALFAAEVGKERGLAGPIEPAETQQLLKRLYVVDVDGGQPPRDGPGQETVDAGGLDVKELAPVDYDRLDAGAQDAYGVYTDPRSFAGPGSDADADPAQQQRTTGALRVPKGIYEGARVVGLPQAVAPPTDPRVLQLLETLQKLPLTTPATPETAPPAEASPWEPCKSFSLHAVANMDDFKHIRRRLGYVVTSADADPALGVTIEAQAGAGFYGFGASFFSHVCLPGTLSVMELTVQSWESVSCLALGATNDPKPDVTRCIGVYGTEASQHRQRTSGASFVFNTAGVVRQYSNHAYGDVPPPGAERLHGIRRGAVVRLFLHVPETTTGKTKAAAQQPLPTLFVSVNGQLLDVALDVERASLAPKKANQWRFGVFMNVEFGAKLGAHVSRIATLPLASLGDRA